MDLIIVGFFLGVAILEGDLEVPFQKVKVIYKRFTFELPTFFFAFFFFFFFTSVILKVKFSKLFTKL